MSSALWDWIRLMSFGKPPAEAITRGYRFAIRTRKCFAYRAHPSSWAFCQCPATRSKIRFPGVSSVFTRKVGEASETPSTMSSWTGFPARTPARAIGCFPGPSVRKMRKCVWWAVSLPAHPGTSAFRPPPNPAK